MRKRTIASLTADIEDLKHQLYTERGRHNREVKLLQDDIAHNRIAHEEIARELREEIEEIKTQTLSPRRRQRILRILEVAEGLSDREIAQKVNVTPEIVELVRRSLPAKTVY